MAGQGLRRMGQEMQAEALQEELEILQRRYREAEDMAVDEPPTTLRGNSWIRRWMMNSSFSNSKGWWERQRICRKKSVRMHKYKHKYKSVYKSVHVNVGTRSAGAALEAVVAPDLTETTEESAPQTRWKHTDIESWRRR